MSDSELLLKPLTVLCRWTSCSSHAAHCKSISCSHLHDFFGKPQFLQPLTSAEPWLLWSDQIVVQLRCCYKNPRFFLCRSTPPYLSFLNGIAHLTHPSPVSQSQALRDKVTKGCNLPTAKCDSGTGCVRNTCENPSSR